MVYFGNGSLYNFEGDGFEVGRRQAQEAVGERIQKRKYIENGKT
jgi:hypothetical protein